MIDTGEPHRRLPLFVKEEFMNATIMYESRGRIRLKLKQKRMTIPQADLLETWLQEQPWVRRAIVHERTCCVSCIMKETVRPCWMNSGIFHGRKQKRLRHCRAHSSRALNREFEEKLAGKILYKAASTLFLPPPLRIARILWHMIPFVKRGLGCLRHRCMKVEMLDALSVSISVCRKDFGTAGMVMFLLEVGELLEE